MKYILKICWLGFIIVLFVFSTFETALGQADTIPPTIKLIGLQFDSIPVFSAYQDPGVNVSDNHDSPSSIIITKSGTFYAKFPSDSATLLGTYTIIYTATDKAGNKSSITRNVIVFDHVPPVLTLKGPQFDSVEVFSTYIDSGVTWSDNYDRTNDITVTMSGTFLKAFPGDTAKLLGPYTVIYTATDKSGNVGSITRTIYVVDHEPPTIPLLGPQFITVCQNSNYVDQGYIVTDNYYVTTQTPPGIAVKMWVNGNKTTWLGGVINSPGFYTVRYSGEDLSYNVGWSAYRYVLVKSKNDPNCGTQTAIDTTVCKGSCPYFTAPISGTSYLWSTGDKTKTVQFCPKNDTAIYVSIINGTDTISYLYGIHVTPYTCVWPGDANNDGVADKNDILAIGVAFGDTGAKRTNATTDWTGQSCMDWSGSFKSSANYKNADCNGDGIIDSTDMLAITKNYGYTHNKASSNGNPTDPPLSIAFFKNTANGGDTVSAYLNLGSTSKSVTNAYGLTFSIKYDVKYVKPGSIKADLSKCWLGTAGKNLMYLVYNDTINGVLNIGITRTDHKNISGFGELGNLSLMMQNNIAGKTLINRTVYLTITDVKMISANESLISIYATSDSMIVSFDHSTGIYKILPDNAVQLYPNPVSQHITINAGDLIINRITVMNVVGEKVYENKIVETNKLEVPVQHLIPGIYSIVITTKEGNFVKSFVKE